MCDSLCVSNGLNLGNVCQTLPLRTVTSTKQVQDIDVFSPLDMTF
jgi:hypothetical protein